jgi:hypothetical protein
LLNILLNVFNDKMYCVLLSNCLYAKFVYSKREMEVLKRDLDKLEDRISQGRGMEQDLEAVRSFSDNIISLCDIHTT